MQAAGAVNARMWRGAPEFCRLSENCSHNFYLTCLGANIHNLTFLQRVRVHLAICGPLPFARKAVDLSAFV